MSKGKIIKLIIANTSMAAIMIALFSPGIVGLSLSGTAFHIALSVATGVTLPLGLFLYDKSVLLNTKPPSIALLDNKTNNIEIIYDKIKEYKKDIYLGQIAETALKQIESVNESSTKYSELVSRKFNGGLSEQKFQGAIQEVTDTVKQNLVKIYNKMLIFDTKDYQGLQNYKDDNIDDKIQEEKIQMYQNSLKSMCDALSWNEDILNKLYAMMMKISDTDFNEEELSTQIENIKTLTDQLKYY